MSPVCVRMICTDRRGLAGQKNNADKGRARGEMDLHK